jgi:hypothetical protein
MAVIACFFMHHILQGRPNEMELCGTYRIYDDGEYIGDISVTMQGIRVILEGSCHTPRQGPFRLAVVSGSRVIPLGTMLPDNGLYVYKKSFSKNALVERGIDAIDEFTLFSEQYERNAGTAETPDRNSSWQDVSEPWRLFRDPELSETCRAVSGGLMREESGGELSFAIPLQRDRPFPAMPIFCFGTFEKIQEKPYVVFRLKDGELVK